MLYVLTYLIAYAEAVIGVFGKIKGQRGCCTVSEGESGTRFATCTRQGPVRAPYSYVKDFEFYFKHHGKTFEWC